MDENPEDYHRWEIQHNPEYFQRFHDLQRELFLGRPEIYSRTSCASFITQDEIDAVLEEAVLLPEDVTESMSISWSTMI